MGHTGGDLSLPDEIKRRVMPSPFPVFDEMERVRDAEPATIVDPKA